MLPLPLAHLPGYEAPGLRPGLELLAQGQYEAAEAKIGPFLATHRDNVCAYVAEASTWLARQQYGSAIVPLEAGMASLPKYEPGWRELGRSYYYQKRYDRATDDCEKALALDPHDPDAWLLKGLAQGMSHHEQAAVASLHEATVLTPTLALAWQQEGRFLFDAHQYRAALPVLTHALQLAPQDAPTRTRLQTTYEHLGQPMRALALKWGSQ
ncbi:MAG TPA: tetratricopeptide repeat protein [Oscillatoriaceae cyanobacterium]